MPVVELARADLLPVVRRLKSEFAFDLLLDVTAVDWPTKTPRFEVVYHFYSTRYSRSHSCEDWRRIRRPGC